MSGRPRRQARHRSWLAALLVAAAALAGGCQTSPATAPPATAAPAGQHQPDPIRFAGRRSTTTEPFLLAGGLIAVSAEHRGSGGFRVEILNQKGAPQRVLFLATGRYRGSTGMGLSGGIYRLAVSGATPWTVRIDQPRGRAGAALPQRYRGSGDALVGPFQAGGNLVVDTEHHGQGDITVELLGDQGNSLYFLLEETGPVRTSRTAEDLQPGGYYLKVEATQPWRLRLRAG
jgi:hypothetical protein